MDNKDLPARSRELQQEEREHRILVLGSVTAGSRTFAEQFQKFADDSSVPKVAIDYLSDIAEVERIFLGQKTAEEGWKNPKPPIGVVLFPQMRQHDPYSGRGVFINTYGTGVAEYVRSLCEKFTVPLREIKDSSTSGDSSEILAPLLKAISDKKEAK